MFQRNAIRIVDLKLVKQSPWLPRVNYDVRSMTMLGSNYRKMDLLGFERRFMCNTLELPFENPGEIEINDRQMISMLLDLQTLNYLGHADIYRKAMKIFFNSMFGSQSNSTTMIVQ